MNTDGERDRKLDELPALARELDSEEPEMMEALARYAELLEREGHVRALRCHLLPVP